MRSFFVSEKSPIVDIRNDWSGYEARSRSILWEVTAE